MHVFNLRRHPQRCQRLSVLTFFVVTSAAHACLWDWDTLQMERRRFPGTLEMMTGKFVRHSPAYYEWRIQDRTKRMRSPAEDPELADDLAVAYSKLGRHAEAIAIMEQVLPAHPDRYETLANLGTIHMLAGELKVGKEYIDRAIAINPDAHFGREKYQSLLADYFLNHRQSPHPAAEPLPSVVHPKGQTCGFAKFVLEKRGLPSTYYLSGPEDRIPEQVQTELAAAQKGVLGMMHFANYDSPLLLEALGDLLLAWPTYKDDALQLAARAYYRVAEVSDDETTNDEFKKAAANMVEGHLDYINYRRANSNDKDSPEHRHDLVKLSTELNRELADGQAYFDTIAADERHWIAEGVDVDQAFAAKHYDSLEGTIAEAEKQLASEWRDVRGNPYEEARNRALLVIGGILAGLGLFVWATRWTYRRINSRSS